MRPGLMEVIGIFCGISVLFFALIRLGRDHQDPVQENTPKTYSALGAAGAVLADVWLDDVSMPVIDSLGEEFLDYVKDDMSITIKEDGTVVVE